MKTVVALVLGIAGMLGMMVLIGALFSLPVMLLWDWLMPNLFGLQEITLFQAWGLLTLCSFLFKTSESKSK